MISPFLLVNHESIAFNLHSDYSIDTHDFCQWVSAATGAKQPVADSVHLLDQAVRVYRGEFLDSLSLEDSPIFEDWILSRREFYRGQALEALTRLAEASLAQGDTFQVKEYARQQIKIEPWREEAHGYLMQALAQEGKRSEALAQYHSCCSLLEKELNVGPGPGIIQLFERIRNDDLASGQVTWAGPVASITYQNPIVVTPAPRMHNLPRSLTSFIGREEEMAKLKQLIAGHDLITLTGPAGVGKSRLVLEVARQLPGEFRDGVWLIDLEQLDQPDRMIPITYCALGLSATSEGPTLQGLVNYLYSRQILLVFDNCEHLLKPCAELVLALLQACPNLKILVTSRMRFGVPGEEIYRVPPLAYPNPQQLLSLKNSLDYPALRLFVERALAIHPSVQITEHNLSYVVSICNWLNGIPLAIEMAANRLELLTLEQLASRLPGSYQLLTQDDCLATPGHQNYCEMFDWSYQKLSEKERLLLQRLSVFDNGWTLDAAEQVCAGEGIDGSELLSLLTGLVNKSAVLLEDQPEAGPRFRLLNMVQQYAEDKLRQTGEERRLRTAHCAYFRRLAEAASLRLWGGDYLAWIKKLDADRENLFRAIRWAIDEGNDVPGGLQILLALKRWWMLRGYFMRAVEHLRKGLAIFQDQSGETIRLHVEALCLLSKLETNRNISFSMVQQALLLAHDLLSDNSHELGLSTYTAGFLSRAWDHNGFADLAYVEKSMLIFKGHIPDRSREIGFLLDEKSLAFLLIGDLKQAGSLARASWEIIQDSGDRWFSKPLTSLGKVAIQEGDYYQARIYIEEALAQRIGEEDAWRLEDLELMSYLERVQGHYEDAITLLREAILRSRQQFAFHHFNSLIQELAFTEIECSRKKGASKTEKHLLQAAHLLGAAETGGSIESINILAFPKRNYEPMVAELRARLDSTKLNRAWREGQAMWIDQASIYALEYPLAG